MKFNMGVTPPAIVVQVAEESFQLLHKYMTGFERAQAVSAMSRGLAGGMEMLGDHVIGWAGVENADGTPMPFHRTDESGQVRSNLDAVMGRLPWLTQLKIVFIQFAMNGVAFRRFRELAEEFVDDEAQLDALAAEIEPFLSRPGGSPSSSSSSSLTPAISGNGSASA